MEWRRVHGFFGFSNNPQIIPGEAVLKILGKSGLADYIMIFAWCSRNRTNGEIPADAMPGINVEPDSIKRLLQTGLLEERDGGYKAVRFNDCNIPQERKQHRSVVNSVNGTQGAIKRWEGHKDGPLEQEGDAVVAFNLAWTAYPKNGGVTKGQREAAYLAWIGNIQPDQRDRFFAAVKVYAAKWQRGAKEGGRGWKEKYTVSFANFVYRKWLEHAPDESDEEPVEIQVEAPVATPAPVASRPTPSTAPVTYGDVDYDLLDAMRARAGRAG